MECRNPNCSNELTGRQKSHCSDRCRKALSRTDKSDISNPDTKVGQPEHIESRDEILHHLGRLQHYLDNPSRYVTRTAPEKLNWGPWLDAVVLKARGFVANRVSIPGDWDYAGVGG